MSVKTFDPAQVVLSFGGIPMSGYADGEFISIEPTSDDFQMSTGADGDTSRVKMNDNSATLTLTLAMTSPSNDILTGFRQLDKRTGQGVVPCICKDLSGRTTVFSGNAWIRRAPTVKFGKEISTREWMIDLANAEIFDGGNGEPIPTFNL